MTASRHLLLLVGGLLGLSLLGNVYAVSHIAGDRLGRASFAELATRRFEPEFGRLVRREIVDHAGELRLAIADLRTAREHMFDLAAANPPDPKALAQATEEVRAAFTRVQSIFHEGVVEAARQASRPVK
ncbi:periplasmic heavy metal sensor [Pleomorphomonas sp. JP5]|uniref:periplasmic heavy metal sensor n=1 Tax=Pleomorphomonas sp. JP5 TaxID=2942998 RepID=UPI002044499F|nr:periplasmic heavy metal sensor [Pleomorphomonas sp. JP5]MCM5556213.1 periplasmic heavy metal sensor [Pleomorphomonas sp. JP5]